VPSSVVVVLADDAVETISEIATPQLEIAAAAIAQAIPENVPVVTGAMKASYKVTTEVAEGADGPEVRVYPGSPYWHWMEFGTINNPPYRPIQRAVESVGMGLTT
jgi:hypothetical protein